MSTGVLIAIALAAVIVVVALWWVLTYNGLRALQQACDDAWSLIDVQLQRRTDLVPNLVAVTEAYAAHERAVLERLAAARAAADPLHRPTPDHEQAERRVGEAIGEAVAIAERYPELQASEQFLALQAALGDLETQIAASREIYNGNVRVYADRIQQVPSRWVARAAGCEPRPFWAA